MLFALNLAFNFPLMRNFTIFFSLLFCININAQKGNIYLSRWINETKDYVNIPNDDYSYSGKGKFYYFIANGSDNLIIYIKTGDPVVQNRILKEGLTVWICMDKKLIRNMGVRFPIGSLYSGSNNPAKIPGTETKQDGSPSGSLSAANTIELIGFTGEIYRRFPSENADSFNGSVKFDNEGILHYQMIMPITKLPLRNSRDGVGAMPFTFGIEYGAVINPAQKKTSVPSVLIWIMNIKLATSK